MLFLYIQKIMYPHFTFLFVLLIVLLIVLEHQIRMNTEGSCDTEDCSNDWGKFNFTITGIKYLFKYKIVILNVKSILQSLLHCYCFYFIFNQINAALVRHLLKHLLAPNSIMICLM